MAKHDQRILKFLTQNAERAPTITDMMTRLNISISDITASLNSLMAQGMVSKRTNAQGIECWFPSYGASPQGGVERAPVPRSADLTRRAAGWRAAAWTPAAGCSPRSTARGSTATSATAWPIRTTPPDRKSVG